MLFCTRNDLLMSISITQVVVHPNSPLPPLNVLWNYHHEPSADEMVVPLLHRFAASEFDAPDRHTQAARGPKQRSTRTDVGDYVDV